MTLVSKEKLEKIREDVEAALAEIAGKHGIDSFKLGTLRYDEHGFRASLGAQFTGAESREMKVLRYNANDLGFSDEIVGATITYSKKQCKVIGLKRDKLILLVDGQEKTAPTTQVLNVLKHQKSPLVLWDSPQVNN